MDHSDFDRKTEIVEITTPCGSSCEQLLLANARLAEAENKLAILLDNMPGGVFSYDLDTGKFDFVSRGVTEIFHCTEEQFRDHFYNNFSLMVMKLDRERVKEQICDQLKFFDMVELTYRVEDLMDNQIWIYHRGRLSVNREGQKKFYVVISDVTEEKLVQKQMTKANADLRAKVETDPMTGLLNKVSMEQSVRETIANSPEGACHAMLMVDTDNFKSVNDTFGHQFGDEIIKFVASSIRKIFRESDFVGRMGGDEFMVFMKNTTATITRERAKQLNDAIRRTLKTDAGTVQISCSIGISYYTSAGDDYDSLYSEADAGLYDAKKAGKDCFRVH